MIQDSGNRREFETGAVRDIAEGKGRCDLMPLDVIGIHLCDSILTNIDKFMREGDTGYIHSAIRQFGNIDYTIDGDEQYYTMFLELAKHYEDGCRKYGERNWEKGIPCHCYIDSAVRHYFKYLRGDEDEPHNRAFLWNLFGLLWTIEHHPELNDLPYIHKDET